MKSRLMISVAAIALLAGAGLANAQGGTKSESGGGATMQQTAPSGGGATTGRESGGPSQAQPPSEKSPGAATKGQRAEEKMPGATKPKSAEELTPGAAKSKSVEEKTPGATKPKSAEEQMPGAAKSKSVEEKTPGAAKPKSAEEQVPGAKSKTMSSDSETKGGATKAEGREGQTNKNAEGSSQMTTGQAGSGAKLSTEQRTKITTVIRNEHVEAVNNVDFNITVGTRVPRERVHLRPLPSEVITIYPEWRGYQFILVRNEILVIDPATYEIVAVLPA
jgi:hypothetical protein